MKQDKQFSSVGVFVDDARTPRSLATQEQISQLGSDKTFERRPYSIDDKVVFTTAIVPPQILGEQNPAYKYSSIKRGSPVDRWANSAMLPQSLADQEQIYQFNTDVWRDRVIYHTMSLGFSAFEPRGQVITLSASTIGSYTYSTELTALCALDSIDGYTGDNDNFKPKKIHKQGDIIFTASEQQGIDTFKVDANGFFTHKDNDLFDDGGTAMNSDDVFADNNLAYLATKDDGLLTYAYTSEGVLEQKSKYNPTSFNGESVWGDGTFIYTGSTSYHDSNGNGLGGLHVLSVDSSTGVMTYEDNDDQGEAAGGCGTATWVTGNAEGHHIERVSDSYQNVGGNTGVSPFTNYPGSQGNNALDSDPDYNYWLGHPTGNWAHHWLIVDLGVEKCVSGIQIKGYNNYSYGMYIYLKYSSTNSPDPTQSWAHSSAGQWYMQSGNYVTKTFTQFQSRYVYIQTQNANVTYSIIKDMKFLVADLQTTGPDTDKNVKTIWGDGTYVYAGLAKDGVHTYGVDSGGNLDHKYSIEPDSTGTTESIHGDGTFIYVANRKGVQSYQRDGNGELTLKHNNTEISAINSNYEAWSVRAVSTKLPSGDVEDFVYVGASHGNVFRFSVSNAGILTLVDYTYTGTEASTHTGIDGDEDLIYSVATQGVFSQAVSAVTSSTEVVTGAEAVTRLVELMPFAEFNAWAADAYFKPLYGGWSINFHNLAHGIVTTTTSTMTGALQKIQFSDRVSGPILTTSSTITGSQTPMQLLVGDQHASTADNWVSRGPTGTVPFSAFGEAPKKVGIGGAQLVFFDVLYNKFISLQISNNELIEKIEDLPANFTISSDELSIEGIVTFKTPQEMTVETDSVVYTVTLTPYFYVIRNPEN